jgi:hypothetical protein
MTKHAFSGNCLQGQSQAQKITSPLGAKTLVKEHVYECRGGEREEEGERTRTRAKNTARAAPGRKRKPKGERRKPQARRRKERRTSRDKGEGEGAESETHRRRGNPNTRWHSIPKLTKQGAGRAWILDPRQSTTDEAQRATGEEAQMRRSAAAEGEERAALARGAAEARARVFPVEGHGEPLAEHDGAGTFSLELAGSQGRSLGKL